MKLAVLLLCLSAAAQNPYVDRMREVAAPYGLEVVVWDGPDPQVAALYDPNQDRVFVRSSHAEWEAEALRRYSSKKSRAFYSSPSPDHVIRHEIGHAMFARSVGIAGWEAVRLSPLPLDAERIRKAVSGYATTGPLEFIAEVYAGVWHGHHYPDDILAAYRQLWHAGKAASQGEATK